MHIGKNQFKKLVEISKIDIFLAFVIFLHLPIFTAFTNFYCIYQYLLYLPIFTAFTYFTKPRWIYHD